VPIDALPRIETLPALLARRARHIVTENDRVLRARAALLAGDLDTLGRLFNASHASMRDDYEVSIDPVDRLVDAATALPNVFGARLTGGGFGGAVVIAAAAGYGREIASKAAAAYRHQTGRDGAILIPPVTLATI
jgi:galactokinase